MSKVTVSIGIDFDARGVRMVKVKGIYTGKEVKPAIMGMHEVSGDYSQQEALIGALKSLAEKLKPKRLKAQPDADLKRALRSEIRKSLTFEMAGAALDYQVMDENGAKSDTPLITVTAVAKTLIDQQTRILSKAGLMPAILDVLPAAIANTCWIAPSAEAMQPKAHVVAHLAPDLCTLVIDGHGIPFYTRSIYFAADRFFGPASGEIGAQEKSIQLDTLADELRRSLAYYSTTNGISDFLGISMIGNYVENAEVPMFFEEKTGLAVSGSSLLTRMGFTKQETPGKYDVAIALAVRGLHN
jgi:Tfp pilus assembly PilM family ATPase